MATSYYRANLDRLVPLYKATFGENYLICRRAPRSPHHAPLRDPLTVSPSIN
jgi:hypothetical protein